VILFKEFLNQVQIGLDLQDISKA